MAELRIGTKVRMVNCAEAKDYGDVVWVTRSEPWVCCGEEVLKLLRRQTMADILIRGMEFPASGEYYITLYVFDNGAAYIDASLPQDEDRFDVIPIPPHGRLGDLDRLEKRFTPVEAYYPTEEDRRDYDNGRLMIRDIRSAIKDAPTIIPASEVKNDG